MVVVFRVGRRVFFLAARSSAAPARDWRRPCFAGFRVDFFFREFDFRLAIFSFPFIWRRASFCLFFERHSLVDDTPIVRGKPPNSMLRILRLDADLPASLGVNSSKSQSRWTKFERDLLELRSCLLYTSPSPRDLSTSRMPSSA